MDMMPKKGNPGRESQATEVVTDPFAGATLPADIDFGSSTEPLFPSTITHLNGITSMSSLPTEQEEVTKQDQTVSRTITLSGLRLVSEAPESREDVQTSDLDVPTQIRHGAMTIGSTLPDSEIAA